jgi:hypothetical protein
MERKIDWKQSLEVQSVEKTDKSSYKLMSKGGILRISSYLWQDIFDFLDDRSFYRKIPLICKYFQSIISDCKMFRSFFNLSKTVPIFDQYCTYINIEKLTIHLSDDTSKIIQLLNKIASSHKITTLKLEDRNFLGYDVTAEDLNYILTVLPNITSISILNPTNDLCSAIDEVITSKIRPLKMMQTDNYAISTAQKLINHPIIQSVSLAFSSDNIQNNFGVFLIPKLQKVKVLTLVEDKNELCKVLYKSTNLRSMVLLLEHT